jgi:hypothetical protein
MSIIPILPHGNLKVSATIYQRKITSIAAGFIFDFYTSSISIGKQMKNTLYKVVEVTTVTDEELEIVINEWVQKGWSLDTIQFAMREPSKRPAMAFVIFTKSEEG